MFSAPDYSFGWLLPRSALKQLGKIDHWRVFASRFSFICFVLKLFPLLGHISWNHVHAKLFLGKHHNCKWFKVFSESMGIIALSHSLCESTVFDYCQYQFKSRYHQMRCQIDSVDYKRQNGPRGWVLSSEKLLLIHTKSWSKTTSWSKFSLRIPAKLQLQKLDQISASKSWPKYTKIYDHLTIDLKLTGLLIFVIFFTRAKFLENKIYTEKRQFFALNL